MKKFLLILVLVCVGVVSKASDSLDVKTLQTRLNNGETPKQLITAGAKRDDLYGLKYQGGHIFYFFPNDTAGMVIGPKDLSYPYDKNKTQIAWNCRDTLIGANERAIGSGMRNSIKIKEAGCKLYDVDNKIWMLPAAELCLDYKGGGYDDWFLPSKDELHEAYMKLSYTGKVKFGNKDFWSSTEVNKTFAAIEYFKDGGREHEMFGQSNFKKFYFYWVRPVRVFKM